MFHELPAVEALAQVRQTVPADPTRDAKPSRDITHMKRPTEPRALVDALVARAETLKA